MFGTTSARAQQVFERARGAEQPNAGGDRHARAVPGTRQPLRYGARGVGVTLDVASLDRRIAQGFSGEDRFDAELLALARKAMLAA